MAGAGAGAVSYLLCRREVTPGPGTAALCRGCSRAGGIESQPRLQVVGKNSTNPLLCRHLLQAPGVLGLLLTPGALPGTQGHAQVTRVSLHSCPTQGTHNPPLVWTIPGLFAWESSQIGLSGKRP